MPNRETKTRTSPVSALDPATYNASPAPLTVDLLGYDSALLIMQVGVGGITFTGVNRVDFTLQHSVDGVSYTNVADADLVGITGTSNGILRSLIAAHAAADLVRIAYIGTGRYLQLTPVFGGVHATGTPMSAIVERGYPSIRPTL